MTSLRVNCPKCGLIELPATMVTLDEKAMKYRFHCFVHEGDVVKDANRPIVDMLKASGVKEELGAHPEQKRPGEAFTVDDLIEFHAELDDVECPADLLNR